MIVRAQRDLRVDLGGQLPRPDAVEVFHLQLEALGRVLDLLLLHRLVGRQAVDEVAELLGRILAEVVLGVLRGLERRNEHAEPTADSVVGLLGPQSGGRAQNQSRRREGEDREL